MGWIKYPIDIINPYDLDIGFKRYPNVKMHILELFDKDSLQVKDFFRECVDELSIINKVIKEIKYPLTWLGKPNDEHVYCAFKKFILTYHKCFVNNVDYWQKASETAWLKCLTLDSPILVTDFNGGYCDLVEIADIIPNLDTVLDTTERNGICCTYTDTYVFKGIRPKHSSTTEFSRINWINVSKNDRHIVRIVSEFGAVDLTYDHKVAFFDKNSYVSFIEAKEFTNNNEMSSHLMIKSIAHKFNKTFEVDFDEGWIWGLLVAEGYVSSKKSIFRIYNTNEKVLEKAQKVLERLIEERKLGKTRSIEFEIKEYECFKKGVKTNLGERKKTLYTLQARSNVRGSLRALCKFVEERIYTKLRNKRIPYKILHANEEGTLGFLCGYLEGDKMHTSSKILATGLLYLGYKLGLKPYIISHKVNDLEVRFYRGNARQEVCELLSKYGAFVKDRQYPHSRKIVRVKEYTNYSPNIVVDINIDNPHAFWSGGAIVHNCGDCEDSATLMHTGLLLKNVESLWVIGEVYMREDDEVEWLGGHAWVCARLLGEWRLIETTLDTTISSIDRLPKININETSWNVGKLIYNAYLGIYKLDELWINEELLKLHMKVKNIIKQHSEDKKYMSKRDLALICKNFKNVIHV